VLPLEPDVPSSYRLNLLNLKLQKSRLSRSFLKNRPDEPDVPAVPAEPLVPALTPKNLMLPLDAAIYTLKFLKNRLLQKTT
jgi:hypothetical protein